MQLTFSSDGGPRAAEVSFFRSLDRNVDAGDALLGRIALPLPSGHRAGLVSIAIGNQPGALPLPGAGVDETDEAYLILAVAGRSPPIALTGSYRPAGGSTLFVHGTPTRDIFQISANAGHMVIGSGPLFALPGVRDVRVRGQEGFDAVDIHDSFGDDVLHASPGKSEFSGHGFRYTFIGVEQVTAFSRAGGFDVAYLNDTPGDDQFDTTPFRGYLSGPDYIVHAELFDQVHGVSTAGGRDIAHLWDSIGNDVLHSTPQLAELSGPGYQVSAAGFTEAHAYSTRGGHDVARLADSPGDDQFHGKPTQGYLTGDGFLNSANDFDLVTAEASHGIDDAFLQDSSGDESLLGRATTGQFSGDGFRIVITSFDRIAATFTAGEDVVDVASVSYLYEQDGPSKDRLTCTPMDFSDDRIAALARHELPAIYRAYGIMASSSSLARLDAIRDWVARMAIHPEDNGHFDGTTSNLDVLPPGKSWADANVFFYDDQRLTNDSDYWSRFKFDGYAMLDALLGRLDPTSGQRDTTGWMEQIGPARYRIKNLAAYPFVQCTWQVSMYRVLVAAAGFHSMLVSLNGHDAAAAFVPSLGKWVYQDVTFNQRLATRDTHAASPLELLTASQAGGPQFAGVTSVKRQGPNWDLSIFGGASDYTYFLTDRPPLMSYLRSHLQGHTLGGITIHKTVVVAGSTNDSFAWLYPEVDDGIAFPQLRTAPGNAPAPPSILVLGSGAGSEPRVRVLNEDGLTERFSFLAYNANFRGGVRVATADFNGDGALDIITAAGPGGGPHVRVFDGATGAQLPGPLGSFMAYDPSFAGGVFVAAGDLSGDGVPDIVTAAGAGGGPHVRVFDGRSGFELGGFFAYDPGFGGGVSVAVADLDGDEVLELITGAGPGGGPHVRVFRDAHGTPVSGAAGSFFAHDPGFLGGVFVAATDFNLDGRSEIVAALGISDGVRLRIFDARDGSMIFDRYEIFDDFTMLPSGPLVASQLGSILPLTAAMLSGNNAFMHTSPHAATDNILANWTDDAAAIAPLAPPLPSLSR